MSKPTCRRRQKYIGNIGIGPCIALMMGVVLMLSGCTGPFAFPGDSQDGHKFQTWQELQFVNVVRQKTDFTCGAAALSILSKYFTGHNIEEEKFTDVIKARYSEEEWRRREGEGLTLLDLKQAAESFGFQAEGMKLTTDAMLDLRGPVIVHLDKSERKHFSVLRGVDGDRVYLADPIRGNVRMPLFRFAGEWTGYALMVWPADHPVPTDYPLQLSLRDSSTEALSARQGLYLVQPPTNNFILPPL